MRINSLVFAALLAYGRAQDILTVLSQQDGVSQFTDILSQYSDLVDYLNTDVHTFLVPTDTAVDQAKALTPEVFNDTSHLRALVEYHILKDTHPTAVFSNASQLVPTLLTNTSFTNVTGGQRVELLAIDEQPVVLSAVKATSKITHGDVFYVGGLVHIIDSTLQIPLDFPTTIQRAKLTYLTALLDKGNWLNQSSVAYTLALETPDLTMMSPNDPKYGVSFTGWDGLNQDQLDQIIFYHAIPQAIYTSELKNNTQLPNAANITLTARDYTNPITSESAFFVNDAHITAANYMTANGVIHVIDRPLDPKNSTLTPSASDISTALGLASPTSSSKKSATLATPAIVGIVLALVAIFLAIGLIIALRIRIRKKRRSTHPPGRRARAISSSNYQQMPPDYNSAVRDTSYPQSQARPQTQSRRVTQNFSLPTSRGASSLANLNAPLPPSPTHTNTNANARPQSAAIRSIRSLRGAIWPSRPPVENVVELDTKEVPTRVDVSELDHESGFGRRDAERIRTPPELDGVEKERSGGGSVAGTGGGGQTSPSSRSHVSITFHGERPKHIGFQAQY